VSVLVITGTSTDVGKTIVTAALAVLLESAGHVVSVCKPAQTGVDPDEAGDLDAVIGLSDPLRRRQYRECVRYPDPLAPGVAARRRGRASLSVGDVVDAVGDLPGTVLVEGAGGVAVRFDGRGTTVLDIARALDARVLAVTQPGLGALNHAELTVDAVRRAGLCCVGLVLGSWPTVPDLAAVTNLAELPAVTGVPIVGRIPDGVGSWSAERFVSTAPTWFIPDFAPFA